MNHYEVLGVASDASLEEIRRAYLEAARRSHPDFHVGDEAGRTASEDRMRLLNLAWEELSDEERRARYDAGITPSTRAHAPPASPRSSPTSHWEPYDPSPASGFDEAHDRPITGGGIPGWLRVAPVLAFAVGIGCVVLGGFTGLLPVVVFGLFSFVASLALFVVAPLVALTSSHRSSRPRKTRS